MNQLHLGENISKLRRKRGVTQDELANFLGVTKASVSKWENGQCMPDIMLLPMLAVYFNISIDELLGFEPWLSSEQIQKIYNELSEEFALKPFLETLKKSYDFANRYYYCYPFLYQLCILWINHYMLAENEEKQKQILEKLSETCTHIILNCKNVGICNDAIILRAFADICLKNPRKAIDEIGEIVNPKRLANNGSEELIIQAYMMLGDNENADYYSQISMCVQLNTFLRLSSQYILRHLDNIEIYEKTVKGAEYIIKTYEFEKINLNTAAVFYYCSAMAECTFEKYKPAAGRLKKFSELVIKIVRAGEVCTDNTSYFTSIYKFFKDKSEIKMVRDKRLILKTAVQNIEMPVFNCLEKEKDYIKAKEMLKEELEKLSD